MKERLLNLTSSLLGKLLLVVAFVSVSTSSFAVSGKGMFTYFQKTEEKPSSVYGLGLNNKSKIGEVYDVAIYVPSSLAGKKIENISFFIQDVNMISNVKAWASKSLPNSASQADIVCLDVTNLTNYNVGGRTSVDVSGNYVVPAQGCYVGYSFTVKSISNNTGKFPITIDEGPGKAKSMYWKTSSVKTNWEDMAETYDCNSSVGVTVSGNDFSSDAVEFASSKFDEIVFLQNTSAYFLTTIVGKGVNPVNSITYMVKDLKTGNTLSQASLKLSSPVNMFGEKVMSFNIPSKVVGTHECQVTITEVNGVPNESKNNAAISGTLLTLEKSATRKVLEEEFTGTWCGWCPYGIVGMERCQKKYPDSWIGIAIHSNDYLASSDFADILAGVDSYPSAHMDRTEDIYPLYADSYVQRLLEKPSEASLQVKANWDATKNKINVTSSVTFHTNRDDAPYGIAYVLVGDDVDGGSECYQNNNLSGSSNSDADLQAWANKGSSVKMNFDHVGIAAKDIAKGMNGSVTAPIVAGKTQQHTTTFDLTNGIQSRYGIEMIQDKSKLKVVAILINRNNGKIVNAEQTTISDYSTGIEQTTADEKVSVVERYSVDGKKLNHAIKGINILKLSNGKVVKVIK